MRKQGRHQRGPQLSVLDLSSFRRQPVNRPAQLVDLLGGPVSFLEDPMALSDPKFRVCRMPQVGHDMVFVQSVESAELGRFLIDVLAAYDLFQYENHVKPDYTNVNWLERQLEDGSWEEVEDEEDKEIE